MTFFAFLIFFCRANAEKTKPEVISFGSKIEEAVNILTTSKVHGLESALLHFDNQFFKLGHYVMLFRSESPQPASQVAPRIVIFSKDGKSRFAFNHKIGSGNDLGAIQF